MVRRSNSPGQMDVHFFFFLIFHWQVGWDLFSNSQLYSSTLLWGYQPELSFVLLCCVLFVEYIGDTVSRCHDVPLLIYLVRLSQSSTYPVHRVTARLPVEMNPCNQLNWTEPQRLEETGHILQFCFTCTEMFWYVLIIKDWGRNTIRNGNEEEFWC